MKNHVIYLSAMALLLTGCIGNEPPPPMLSEQLAGKSPQQRQEILLTDCLNTAEKITGKLATSHPHAEMPSQDVKIDEMKGLCHQMAGAYLERMYHYQRQLKNSCDSLLATVERNQRNTQPLEKMHEICEAMTSGKRS